jgi:hypothetical protein
MKTKIFTYHQGDINFCPLEAFGKSAADVSRNVKLRSTANRVLIQEGEITGHHHGIWFVPQPVHLHDGAFARVAADASPINIGAQLFRDDALLGSLGLDNGAPVVGFLVAEVPVTIRHASADGKPTGEHGDIQLPSGGYLVTGKREWTAGDERRVQD